MPDTNLIDTTPEFRGWIKRIKDAIARGAITGRIMRAEHGNFGDTEPVGDGVSEMRVFIGPGYRVYFVRTGPASFLVLYGSSKMDQNRGIRRCKGNP